MHNKIFDGVSAACLMDFLKLGMDVSFQNMTSRPTANQCRSHTVSDLTLLLQDCRGYSGLSSMNLVLVWKLKRWWGN